MIEGLKLLFTEHPGETENSQTYWQHGKFAAGNSFKLIWAGIAGVVHAVYPPAFPFYTSTRVIKSFKKIVESKRHIDELKRELGENNVRMLRINGAKDLTITIKMSDDEPVKKESTRLLPFSGGK